MAKTETKFTPRRADVFSNQEYDTWKMYDIVILLLGKEREFYFKLTK